MLMKEMGKQLMTVCLQNTEKIRGSTKFDLRAI